MCPKIDSFSKNKYKWSLEHVTNLIMQSRHAIGVGANKISCIRGTCCGVKLVSTHACLFLHTFFKSTVYITQRERERRDRERKRKKKRERCTSVFNLAICYYYVLLAWTAKPTMSTVNKTNVNCKLNKAQHQQNHSRGWRVKEVKTLDSE